MEKLAEYQRHIVENGFVNKEKAGYYAAWLSKFLRLGLSDKLNHGDKLRQYRESLLVEEGIQEWQLNQATHAVELYLNNLPDTPTSANKAAPSAESPQDDLAPRMMEALRLKHYAYRTEKTYLDWLRRYLQGCFILILAHSYTRFKIQ